MSTATLRLSALRLTLEAASARCASSARCVSSARSLARPHLAAWRASDDWADARIPPTPRAPRASSSRGFRSPPAAAFAASATANDTPTAPPLPLDAPSSEPPTGTSEPGSESEPESGSGKPSSADYVSRVNAAARELASARTLREGAAAMSKHWTITYAILIREASPVPFPFHGGCKFDEGARGGPCFARAANAARVAEGKKPRACTGDAHPGCFHRQGRAFFLAWALNWYLCQKAAHDFAFATLSPHAAFVAAHDPLANLGLYTDPATSLAAWATMLAIGLNNNSSVEMPRVFVTMHAFRWGGWFVASRTAALRRAKRWL